MTPDGFTRIGPDFFPTPIGNLDRLGRLLDGQFRIERDDHPGSGGGGNKVRKLGFPMADALAQGADALLLHCGGGPALRPSARVLTEG